MALKSPSERQAEVRDALRQINAAWLAGRYQELVALVHEDVVMAGPASGGGTSGRGPFVAGFRDFVENARIHAFTETDHQVDVAGNTGVARYRFEMTYEHGGGRYRSTGRDFWVFEEHAGRWLAVWRTIFEVTDEPVT